MRPSSRNCRTYGREKRSYPECNNSGCSRNRSSCEHVQQVRYKPIERIEFVGKEREHYRAAAVPPTRSRNCSECNDSGRSRHSSLCEPIQQVRYKPIEWIDLVGKECEHRRAAAMLLARSQNYPECNDSRHSRHSSLCKPIQQVRYKPSERIDLVGKDAIIIANNHQRSWREVDKAWKWL
jgi:hypothetical protein